MSFQAYIDNIKTKTGKTPADFKKLAEKNGLLKPGVKAGEIVAWLKKDFDLGHGHAMAIYTTLKSAETPKLTVDDAIAKHFSGNKSEWKKSFDALMITLHKFGKDVALAPTGSYISILRKGKKFSVVQITAHRIDIGIKLKGVKPSGRYEASGSWNNMMTHRVKIENAKQIDKELIAWLRDAYEQCAASNK